MAPGDQWTDNELEAAVAAYLQMLKLELADEDYNKASVTRTLLAGPLKARTAIKQRMSNISAVLKEMGRPWIKGYDPLGNVGTASADRIRQVIHRFDQPDGIPLPSLPPPLVEESRGLPPTGYWELVCNRAKWDGEAWLRSGETELFYLVSKHNRHEVQRGDLAVLRLNATSSRPASIYAILEVVAGVVECPDDDDRFYANKADASVPRFRARLRLLQNLVDQPLAATDLPDEPDFQYLKTALQTSTIPLPLAAFRTIVQMSGLNTAEMNAGRLEGVSGGAALPKEPIKVIRRSPEMVLAAYALARLGHRAEGRRDAPPAFLNAPDWRQAYELFYPHFHDGREIRSFRNSLKNARDAFDAHLTSRRTGWRMKDGSPPEPQGLFKATLNAWKDRSDEELRDAVLHILARNPAEPELVQDLQDILNSSATTKTALVEARIGQGAYRADLMKAWNDRCAVTGCAIPEMLRASHVKPWRVSNNAERLDSQNGLILAAHLDALFDRNLITFDESGAMIVAGVIKTTGKDVWGLGMPLSAKPMGRLSDYLRYHRDNLFNG